MGKRERRRQRDGGEEQVRPAMNVEQLRAAGVTIDLPFEAPTSRELRYSDGRSLVEAYPELLEPDLGGPESGRGV